MPDLRIERVVVTGGRGFTDRERIEADLRALLPLGLRRVAQGGNGVDEQFGGGEWPETRAPDDRGTWTHEDGDGRRAPLRRNIRMLEAERPDLVLAYPDPDSRGTWHCVKEACKRGITVAVWATAARLVDAGLPPLVMPDEPDQIEHFIFAQDPALVPAILEVLGADDVQRRLKAAVEVETTAHLWTVPYTFVPAVCSTIFGDGRALLALSTINSRPRYYVIRIDSSWVDDGEDGPDGADHLREHLDEIYDALEDEFGRVVDDDEDPDEAEWPAFDYGNGTQWSRMSWPDGFSTEPHPLRRFMTKGLLRAPQEVLGA